MRSLSTPRSRVIGSSTSLLLTAGCATDSETKTNLFFLGRNAQALVFSAVYTRKNAIERGNTVLKLAVLGGDGTGPEVVAEGLKVLDALSKKNGLEDSTEDLDFGGERAACGDAREGGAGARAPAGSHACRGKAAAA